MKTAASNTVIGISIELLRVLHRFHLTWARIFSSLKAEIGPQMQTDEKKHAQKIMALLSAYENMAVL
jgi:hypothetical protein